MVFPHGGAGQIWRDQVGPNNDGKPEDEAHGPKKSEIRGWGGAVEDRIEAVEGSTFGITALRPRESVQLRATTNKTLSGEQTIDDVLTSASRVLLTAQTDPAENGPWVTAFGAWTRPADVDEASEVNLSAFYVEEGTFGGGKSYVLAVAAPDTFVLGTDAIAVHLAGDAASLTGLLAVGNNLSDVSDPDAARANLGAAGAEDLDGLVAAEELADESGAVFAVVDEGGRRTWMETAPDGGPTDQAADQIGAKLTAGNTPAMMATEDILDESGVLFGFVDEQGRRTDLEVGPDGRFTKRVIDSILAAMEVSGRVVSGPNFVASGDSLTAGSGGGGTSYPSVLAGLTGRVVTNLGVGGEGSRTIAGRVGALPYLATPAGDQLPASGGVTVTLTGTDGGAVAPLLQGSAGLNPCTLEGVTGTLSESGGTYTFTRAASGSVVPVPRPAPVITASAAHKGDIHLFWWGQNDGTNDATDIIARIRAGIDWMDALDKRFLVLGLTTSTLDYRAPMHAQFLVAFGRRFVNLQEYLASYAALSEVEITPTAQDDADIAAGMVPDSLRSDATHLNAAGYSLVANCIHNRAIELGFL
ncbi:hypothetical protein [Pacificoceanicola onchidii]|uniref:hypothetical protein n=1 Tax=Pacificoceanicola onchidii TaxID=2562685 RepID=UPI0010A3160A|nr:hypothetical protein [Pacificoceanicola onchidii]